MKVDRGHQKFRKDKPDVLECLSPIATLKAVVSVKSIYCSMSIISDGNVALQNVKNIT